MATSITGENLPIEQHVDSAITIYILDASGSMAQFGQLPRDAFNGAISELATDNGCIHYVALATFADEMEAVIPLTRVAKDVPRLTHYHADGATKLYSTVFQVISELSKHWRKLEQEAQSRLRITIGVISDGDDNRSREAQFPLQVLAKEARSWGWHLLSVGIGIDSHKLARDLGFSPSKAITVPATSYGVKTSMIGITQTSIIGRYNSAPDTGEF